jgi:hypothetical protein
MSFIKSLWADLVEKRLWPVVLVLLVALVAVPVALGGASEDPVMSASLGAAGRTGEGALTAQVALDPTASVRRDRTEEVRDPFKQSEGTRSATTAMSATGITAPPLTKTPYGGGGGTSATGITAPPLTKTPGNGNPSANGEGKGKARGDDPTQATPTTPTTPEQTTPTPPKQAPPAPDPLDSYVVTLTLGKTGTQRDRETVERLTPLPSATSPFLVYVGVLPDEETAVFLLSAVVKATGEGACKPRTSSCETVELRRGDTEYFAVTGEDGKVTWYQLDFGHVIKKKVDGSGPAAASREASVTSRPKAATEASAQDDLGSDRYAYDEATGLLRRVKAPADPDEGRSSPGDTLRAILEGFGATEEAVAPPGFLPEP